MNRIEKKRRPGDGKRHMPADRIDGEYRRIVSIFNDIVGLHLESLSKVIFTVGFIEGTCFDPLEKSEGKNEPAHDTAGLARAKISNLIGYAGELTKAAVEAGIAGRTEPGKHQARCTTLAEQPPCPGPPRT